MKRLLFSTLACVLLSVPGCSSGKGSGGESGNSKPSANASTGGSSGDAAKSKGNTQPPNTVEVPLDQQAVAGIRVVQLEPRATPRTLTVPGQIMMDEQRTAHIAPYSDGRVVDVLKMVGDPVRKGTVLAHLHSHVVHETVGALAQDFANVARAQSAITYAQNKRNRYQHLYSIQAASLEQQQSSEQEFVQAQTDLKDAQASVTMEREHLGDVLQIDPESITPATLYTYENVPILSPIAGTVITRTLAPGMVFEPGNEAYTVSDLGTVWMVASVSELDLPHLRVGEHVNVTTDAWPGQSFPGRVTLIGSSLDPTTRTVQVRATLANLAGRLKPQMFTTANIDEAETRSALFVPESAMQEVNGVEVVFVTADGTHFTPRALKTLPPIAGEVEVTDGLRAGDRIAAAGAFLLKSDLLKGTIGEE